MVDDKSDLQHISFQMLDERVNGALDDRSRRWGYRPRDLDDKLDLPDPLYSLRHWQRGLPNAHHRGSGIQAKLTPPASTFCRCLFL